MIIDCISDLHGYYPKLEGGDLLIIAGDLVRNGESENEFVLFDYWLSEQKYDRKIVIAGNHDNVLFENRLKLQFCEYLCDSGTKFEGLKIWGSPWTKHFVGMNPRCMAFTLDTDKKLAEKWKLIPQDIDILITHCPPWAIMDDIFIPGRNYPSCVGSTSLNMIVQNIKPTLHVFGHIHEGYGKDHVGSVIFVNASQVNERYKPVNKPIRIDL